MKAAAPPRALTADEVSFRSDVAALGIRSTADLEPTITLGDERGPEALAHALSMRSAGYHAYACGLVGPQRLERVAAIVRQKLRREEPLPDWVYVHDFAEPARPRALRLRAGEGSRLRGDLAALLRDLREDLPKAFHEEAFDAEKARVVEAFQERHRHEEQRLNEVAAREGLAIRFTPQGNLVIVPLLDGKPVENEEQLRRISPERLAELDEARKRVEHDLREHFERSREERHRVDEEIREIERSFARRLVQPRLASIAARYGSPKLARHLDELLEHLLGHLEPFRGEEPPHLPFPLSLMADGAGEEALAVYDVNVVVDNARTEGPTTLVVDSPTYKTLFGSIDRVATRGGQLVTDFRKIQAGAMLRADGGALVLSVEDALVEPFVWRILRRTLRSGRVEIEAYDPFVMFTATALRPEPIQVDTKLVLVGPRWIFEMLLLVDEEFADLFKVLADFAPVVERSEASTRALCGRIAGLGKEEDLLPFDASGLDALVEAAVREAGDRRKLALGSERVLDLARDASAVARETGASHVARAEVRQAFERREHRLDRVERQIREAVERGIVLLEVAGTRVGQINALAVSALSARSFGRAGRVTAAVGLGARGVVNIEREAKLSGATHDKGLLILEGFLRDRFARRRPLSLVVSVAFEQSYGPIDGDSASLAELLAILSRVGRIPLRQDLAITGSVNQAGEVQPVGGLDEKIEGFFDCCRAKGLSGSQGVVIPASNVEHLSLRDDVVEAVRSGRFHLHPVRTVEEAFEAFTGQAAGTPDEPDTLFHAVDAALEEMATRLPDFAGGKREARTGE